jgi:hypothetical protein
MAALPATIRIDRWFQGPTGSGQGGWTAHRFAERIGRPVTIAIRAPIPLDADLHVVADGELWRLVAGDDPRDDDAVTVMAARSWEPMFADTDAVSIDAAATARDRFGEVVTDHPVPHCFSCGLQHDSMRVHAGPLDDGRFATDWTPPGWATSEAGDVDLGTIWAALDCTAAWYAAGSLEPRTPVTAQYAVEVTGQIDAGTTYALVAWSGDHPAEWDGRKRHAASAAFAPDGTCVARTVSLWISVEL